MVSVLHYQSQPTINRLAFYLIRGSHTHTPCAGYQVAGLKKPQSIFKSLRAVSRYVRLHFPAIGCVVGGGYLARSSGGGEKTMRNILMRFSLERSTVMFDILTYSSVLSIYVFGIHFTQRAVSNSFSWGQMSAHPEKGDTVMVSSSRTGRLLLQAPSW